MRTLFYGSCIIIVFSLALNTLLASSEKIQESSDYALEINGKFNIPKVSDLSPGTYYFVLCSIDEDFNLSDLSNIVQVELK